MNKENKVHNMWTTFIGEFYNPNHNKIQSKI